jgi:DNA primase
VKLPTPKQREFYEQAASSYAKQLGDDTAAQEYLTSRGITPEAAATFRLGVVREPLVGHETFRDRLCIPYITPASVVNFTFRCMQAHVCKDVDCPKYLAPPLDRNLYNVLALSVESQTIHVTEGELDALVLTMCGMPAVGIPGVDNWRDHWGLCLEDFNEIFVWADGDAAGRKLAHKLEKELRARRVAMPYGKDVNSVYIDGGSSALRALIGA